MRIYALVNIKKFKKSKIEELIKKFESFKEAREYRKAIEILDQCININKQVIALQNSRFQLCMSSRRLLSFAEEYGCFHLDSIFLC